MEYVLHLKRASHGHHAERVGAIGLARGAHSNVWTVPWALRAAGTEMDIAEGRGAEHRKRGAAARRRPRAAWMLSTSKLDRPVEPHRLPDRRSGGGHLRRRAPSEPGRAAIHRAVTIGRRHPLPTALAVCACLGLGACGSNDEPEGEKLPADSVAALQNRIDEVERRYEAGPGRMRSVPDTRGIVCGVDGIDSSWSVPDREWTPTCARRSRTPREPEEPRWGAVRRDGHRVDTRYVEVPRSRPEVRRARAVTRSSHAQEPPNRPRRSSRSPSTDPTQER